MKLLSGSIVRIARNSFATVIVRGSFGLARIIILMVLAKIYGAYEFGLFSLALTFLEVTKVVADIGVDVVSIKNYGANKNKEHLLLESIIGFKIIASCISVCIALLIFYWMYHNLNGLMLLLVASVSVFTSLIINAFVSYYQTQLSMEKLIGAYSWGIGLYFILSLAALAIKLPLIILMVIIPLTEAVTLIKLTLQYSSKEKIVISYNYSFMKNLLTESIFVGISGIIVVIYLRMDNLMISRLMDIASVGRYALAYRLTEPFSLVFSSFGISLYASLSVLPVSTLVSERISQSLKTVIPMLILAVMAVASFIFFVRPLLSSFSPEYQSSGDVLIILGFVLIFKAINTQSISILNSMGKFRTISIITITNLVVCIGLNIILIPRYGINGAAYAIVGSEAMNTLLQVGTILFYYKQDIVRLIRKSIVI